MADALVRWRVLLACPAALLHPRGERLVLDAHHLGERLGTRAAALELVEQHVAPGLLYPHPTEHVGLQHFVWQSHRCHSTYAYDTYDSGG